MSADGKKDLFDKSVYQKIVNKCKKLQLLFQDIVKSNMPVMSKKSFDCARKYPTTVKDSVIQNELSENCCEVLDVFAKKLSEGVKTQMKHMKN